MEMWKGFFLDLDQLLLEHEVDCCSLGKPGLEQLLADLAELIERVGVVDDPIELHQLKLLSQ